MQPHETVHSEASKVVGAPIYRVNFWERPSPHFAWNLDAYVLTGVLDAPEALQWAGDTAHGRQFEVFVEVDAEAIGPLEEPRKSALVRVFGHDPNTGESHQVNAFVRD